jgi:hypothetical protein
MSQLSLVSFAQFSLVCFFFNVSVCPSTDTMSQFSDRFYVLVQTLCHSLI